jgi:hypothetical protein
LKPFEYIDLVEIFCRDDPRFRAEWLYLMRFIKPVVKIPAHSRLGIHALSARPVEIRDSRAGSPNVGRACYDTISISGNSVTVVIARSVEGNASVIELIGGGIGITP